MGDRSELDRVRGDRAALVRALQDVGATVNGFQVRCPFHADEHPSGAVHEKDGVWWFTCHGCTWNGDKRSGDVVDVVRRGRGLDFAGALAVLGIGRGNARSSDGEEANGPNSRANTPRGTPGRRRELSGAGNVLQSVDADGLAAESAARLQADSAALAKLWKTRAVDADTAKRFGVGLSTDGRYWTFPVSDGGQLVAVKHHRIDPAGDGPKCFWEPRGTDSRRLWPVYLDYAGPVWLCPGELKALAVIAAGRCAVGITGGEAAELPDGLVDLLKGRAVAVAGDDDAQGRKWARAAVGTLRNAGLDVRAVDLGWSKADGLKDISDLIRQWAVDDAREPEAVAAGLDGAYERSDPWQRFTLAGVWNDKATWAPVYHVPTGLRALDDALGGGLRVGGVHLFVGKSGRAKTQTVTQIALNAARVGVPVGFLSLEMSRRDAAHLLAANLGNLPRSWVSKGSVSGESRERLQNVLAEWSWLPLVILDDDYWAGPLTRSRLAGIVAEGCQRFGWRLVVLDYLGLLANEGDETEYRADLETAGTLKRIARVHNIALLAVAALRKSAVFRKIDDAERPTTLDDVLGAGRIVYDAFTVLCVDCKQDVVPEGGQPVGTVRLFPLKTRYSGLSALGRVLELRWFPATGRICDLDPQRTFDTG